MARRRSYVIVTSLPSQADRLPAGRHRLGIPGTVPHYPVDRRQARLRRARHRRAERPSTFAAWYASMVVLLGVVLVSGWFAASGATAFAQMIQP